MSEDCSGFPIDAGPGDQAGVARTDPLAVVAAAHFGPNRVAALAVLHLPRLLAVEVVVAPLHQADEDREEVPALRGEPVLVAAALSGLLVLAGLEDAAADEVLEPVGQHRFGEPDVAPEVVEAAPPVRRVPDHQHRPLLPEEGERALDGALLGVEVTPVDRSGPHVSHESEPS